jgi:Uri superfamily endonuclease
LKGVYVLIINVKKDTPVTVGALGEIIFTRGLYAYVGSAQSNLELRIKRHLKKKKVLFWHIDYMLDNAAAEILYVFVKEADRTEECNIARMMNGEGEAIAGFGSSDCNCISHLVRIRDFKFLQNSMLIFYDRDIIH